MYSFLKGPIRSVVRVLVVMSLVACLAVAAVDYSLVGELNPNVILVVWAEIAGALVLSALLGIGLGLLVIWLSGRMKD